MTVHPNRIQRLRVWTESTFGTDGTGTLANFTDCPFVEGTLKLTLGRSTESPLHSQQYLDGYAFDVLMLKSAQLDFEIAIETVDTKSKGAGAAEIARGALGVLLRTAFGGEDPGTGTTVNDASAGVNENDLTSAAGFAEGAGIGFLTGSGGTLECREIKTISSNTVTTKHALTGAPSNGSNVYAPATYYPDATDGSEARSLQCVVEGQLSNDRWVLLGGQLAAPPQFTLTPQGRPKIAFSWRFAKWLHGAAAATDLTASALAAATYANVVPLVHKDSEFRYQTVGTATIGTLIHAPQIEMACPLTYEPHITSAGVEGINQWVRVRNAPVTGAFAVPFEALTWYTARDDKTKYDFMLQIGTSATDGACLITVPNAQVVNVQPEDIGGISGHRVSFVGGLDTDVSGSSNDLERAPFRLHLF